MKRKIGLRVIGTRTTGMMEIVVILISRGCNKSINKIVIVNIIL